MTALYIERAIEKSIIETGMSFPVVLLTGARQVGKTTVLKKLAQNSGRKYVTLDDPAARELASREPELFLQRYEPPVLIDEIQYAPDLMTHIKIYVDSHGDERGIFWLTGSQVFHLMRGVSESLAGRVGILNMAGLSNGEINGSVFSEFTTSPDILMTRLKSAVPMDLMQVYERIFRGSMPALYAADTDSEKFYYSYVQSYLQRDIRDLTQVADENSFYRFLCVAAARSGCMLNYEAMAREADVSAPTAKRWLSLLVTSGIVILIEPYFSNALKRAVKAPRMYFLDTGLCSHLTRWTSPENLEAGAMSGAIFETWVVSEIYKSFINTGRRPPLFYYRDSNSREVDLIIAKDNTLYPIEIKKSAHPVNASRHFKALLPEGGKKDSDNSGERFAVQNFNLGEGAVICMSQDLLPINKHNWLVPVWLI